MSRISNLLNGTTTNNKTITVNTSTLFDTLTQIIDDVEKAYDKTANKNIESRNISSEVKEQRLVTPHQKEAVNHPSHYQGNKFEVIDIIEDYNLNFNKGNCLKYLLRAGKKNSDSYIQDLEKAIWYLNREIHNYKLTSAEMSK